MSRGGALEKLKTALARVGIKAPWAVSARFRGRRGGGCKGGGGGGGAGGQGSKRAESPPTCLLPRRAFRSTSSRQQLDVMQDVLPSCCLCMVLAGASPAGPLRPGPAGPSPSCCLTPHRAPPPLPLPSPHSQYTGPVSSPEYLSHLPRASDYRRVAPA